MMFLNVSLENLTCLEAWQKIKKMIKSSSRESLLYIYHFLPSSIREILFYTNVFK